MNPVIAAYLAAHADYMGSGKDSSEIISYMALGLKRRALCAATLAVAECTFAPDDRFMVGFVDLVGALSRLDDAHSAVKAADLEASRCHPDDMETNRQAIDETDRKFERAQRDATAAHRRFAAMARVETFDPAFVAFVEWNADMTCEME